MGDVAGIGPEVIARAWSDPALHTLCRPFVIGHAAVLKRAVALVGTSESVQPIDAPEQASPCADTIPCLDMGGPALNLVIPGTIDARAGKAAHEFLDRAIDLALAHRIDAITTLPLNKEALHAAGIRVPGHTEILADRCGVTDYAMMLYVAPPLAKGSAGLGVVHATLHVPLRHVFELLTGSAVLDKIRLADQALRPLTGNRPPRIGVAGLNPHAGEHGLFGDEEERIISPAIAGARAGGILVEGPIAADTLFARALAGEFDGVVAMYHDQGHVAIKTVAFRSAVNVTLGLPIIRTSVAHGTAFDIAWQGKADHSSLLEAIRVAANLVSGRRALEPA
jgi:4-hydroxythreonine-4-phosphate dehydrogenase